MDVRGIQAALKAAGFDPGAVDGVWGRQTIAAVKAFQQAQGLRADGIVGPLTLNALGAQAPAGAPATPAAAASAGPLVWYDEALRLVGLQEDTSPASNQAILDWAGQLGISYASDDVPWCGLFVAHCIGATLTEERLPNAPLAARSWQKFGLPSKPRRGAVLVFWRESKASFKGHVGFYFGEDDQAYHVLGGNQSDAVTVTRVARSRLLEARWPATAAMLTGPVVRVAANGALSVDEA